MVIDAQVFFDFDADQDELTLPSHALLNDSLVDAITIWHTDELLQEIGRNSKAEERRRARERASSFWRLNHDPLLLDMHATALREILPYRTDQDISDVRHLAMTASSDVKLFVTRDERILKNADKIQDLTGVRVLNPTQLLLEIHQRSAAEPPSPDRISGPSVEWRTLSSHDLAQFPWDDFLHPNERRAQLRDRIGALAARSENTVEVLRAGDKSLAFRVLEDRDDGATVIHAARVSAAPRNDFDRGFVAQFILIDSVKRSVQRRRPLVQFAVDAFPLNLVTDLGNMGFTKVGDTYLRFSFTGFSERDDLMERIKDLRPDAAANYAAMDNYAFQGSCSPVVAGDYQRHVMIPIRPAFARSLVDRQQSATVLFGDSPHLLMGWTNVYYRTASRQQMLRPPAKVLWYVSSPQREIMAVSDLQEVVLDTPRELLRRFSRYGTLDWDDLFRMARGDTQAKLMALIFTGTFELNRRVPLSDVWKVFDSHNLGRSVQSPRSLPFAAFREFLRLGYAE